MTQQLSSCCKAPVTVSSSDEGTGCFMCGECKRPCDLQKDRLCSLCNDILDATESEYCEICIATNKEQVSVDKKCVDCGNIILHPESLGICKECEIKARNDIPHDLEWRKRHGVAKRIYVDAEEYERLKRLDENVNKLIAELKLIDGETTPSSLSKLLKGLYDE